MKMKSLFAIIVLLFGYGLFAQEKFAPTTIIEGTFMGKTEPLRDHPTINPADYNKSDVLKIIDNNLNANQKVNQDALPIGKDPLIQKNVGQIASFALEQNFDGLARNEGGGFTPPDPSGAAGPNHYIAAVNVALKIFDKEGNLMAGPTDLGSFLGSGNNSGDPIIMYDHLADRFFVSQFGAAGNSLVLGVSETSDPTGSYYVYQYILDAFPDYPHYSIWHDAYYFTANKGGANTTYAIEREVILNGGASPQIVGFNLAGVNNNSGTVFSPEPSNLTGLDFPADAPGYVVYLQDDGWAGASFDHLRYWEMDLDWNNTANSTITAGTDVPTAPFDAVFQPFGSGDLNQPGTGQKIDMIGGVISYAANYRSFGTHNSWLITFNVDTDGNDTAGVRWIELRNTGNGPWSIFQEGTYAPNDGHSRFMGSAAMDGAGNIGLAFNIGSATLPVGIRYTGRFDGDPMGQMTVAETTIVDGIGVQTNTNRFGDYSHLTMDPDNFTFWHTAEYFTANNNWSSRVAAFSLSGGFAKDLGVNNIVEPNSGILTSTETVEVSVRNYGTDAQSSFPVELRVDGSLVATETFSGTVNPGETGTYSFTQTVDLSTSGQTYLLEARTAIAGDEFEPNNDFAKEVTHLLANDVGVLEIVAPESGSGIGIATVSVNVKNFGASAQSGFDVQYSIDGGPEVVEAFSGTIDSEEEVVFDFTVQGDFSELGTYTIVSSTSLSGDQEPSNDEATTEIDNILCIPAMDCSFGDGFQLVSIAEINNTSGCEGYADFTDLVGNVAPGVATPITFTTGYGDQHVRVWIDFNDDLDFSPNETVVANFIIAPGQAAGSYTETVDLQTPANAPIGEHRMRAKSNWQAPVSDDPCDLSQYGETEDYTINIGSLGVDDLAISDSELIILSQTGNNFDVTLTSAFDGEVYVTVFNMLGQQMGMKYVSKDGGKYNIRLDMSSVSSGVYVVKVGSPDATSSKSAKIIVK